MVLVQGPARTKRSSPAWSYAKGGDNCVYSRSCALCGRAVGRLAGRRANIPSRNRAPRAPMSGRLWACSCRALISARTSWYWIVPTI